MTKSTIVVKFCSPIENVWNIVTDNTAYAWRSDIAKIEVSDDGNSFTEFIEEVEVTNPIMKLFVKVYLKKQQATNDFFKTELMIPQDIEEQQKIGDYFKSLNDLITLHQRTIDIDILINACVWEQRKF